jgi:large subunit ribosomal protein L25
MAKDTTTIATEPRERTGTRYAERLRKAGRLPAVVYGQDTAPSHVSVDERELLDHLHMGVRVIELQGAAGSDTCLVKDLQFGYLGDNVIHVDFARVDLNQVVTVNVPIKTNGAPKLASEPGAMLETVRNEIEVECKVSDIPTEITVDLTDMGEALTVGDLPLPDGVKAMLEDDKHIVHITFVKEEEAEGEEAEVDADGSEPEVITEKKEEPASEEGGGEEG